MTGGPDRNRTCTYGFGGHRPIHWTTGPDTLFRRGKAVTAGFRLGKEKDWQTVAALKSPQTTAGGDSLRLRQFIFDSRIVAADIRRDSA
jgi:hypothetical protein